MTAIRDYSHYHHLVGGLFPQLSAREAWDAYRLSNEQLEFFDEFGYLHNIKILDDDQITKLREDLESIIGGTHPAHELFYEFQSNESADPNTVLFHSLGHWRITEGFHDVLWNPRFIVVASQLLGDKAVRFWHDQLFCKPAFHGGVVAWHQDYSYWTRTTPLQHLTCWIGLDDANIENGCLHYIPGSHKWELLEKIDLAGDMHGLENLLTAEQKKDFAKKVAIEMKAGYGTFHHPKLVHGSYENKSSRSRRAFVINVFADGTTSNTHGELLAGVPIVKKGNKLEGQFFPLLFQPE